MSDLQLRSQLPAISRMIKSGSKQFERYRAKRGFDVPADEELIHVLSTGPKSVESPYNKLVNRLGEEFAKGDDDCIAVFAQISVDVERLLVEHLAIRLDNAMNSGIKSFDPEVEQQWETELHNDLDQELRHCKAALSSFVERRWKVRPSSLLQTPINSDSLDNMRGDRYCPAAKHLQDQPDASISDVATLLPDGVTYRCKECALEFKDLELPHRRLGDDEWTKIARSHIRASMSMKDRRAWLMCLECRNLGRETNVISPRSLLHHLKEHATLRQIKERLDGARSAVVL